jgi:hypothetical protein
MKRWIIVAITCVITMAGCDLADPHQAFEIPEWKSMPTDAELVAAIVGVDGSSWERTEAELLTREFLLPRRPQGLEELQSWLGTMKARYDEFGSDAFARFLVRDEAAAIYLEAQALAVVHVHHELWPDESFGSVWGTDYEEWIEASRRSAAERFFAGLVLKGRLSRLESRFAGRLPSACIHWLPQVIARRLPNRFVGRLPRLLASRVPAGLDDDPPSVSDGDRPISRSVHEAGIMVHVALTGDYRGTCGLLWWILTERGVPTIPACRHY